MAENESYENVSVGSTGSLGTGTLRVETKPPAKGISRFIKAPAFWFFVLAMLLSIWVGKNVSPTWTVEKITLDVKSDQKGLFYTYKGKPEYLAQDSIVAFNEARLNPEKVRTLNQEGKSPDINEEITTQEKMVEGKSSTLYYKLIAKRHWGIYSLLPAFVAVFLCFFTREPVSALFGGILSGAFILQRYDLTESVLIPNLSTSGAAGILVLYLWLLGGLMGIWARMGAPQAFADMMTKHVVKGPRSAKLVAWLLGVIFFQGGTVSTVLVGTTVKPLADKENISHEELAYIVDSTASPIASQLAFNAWPGYVQAFIFVAGVSFLATEQDRITFFFKSVPFCFYAIFAVLGTFLLSIDKAPWLSKNLKNAIKRSREKGELDAPGANPLSAKELQSSNVPEGYTPHVIDFFLPLGTLIGLAIGTFIIYGSPRVRWAFGAAVLLAAVMAMLRGMSLNHLVEGFGEGLKGVVMGSVILLLAITIGNLSKEIGGGNYLVELLGNTLPFWALPVLLQILTIIIAFSTGTSWGTYAVAFPLAMPLAWAIAEAQGLGNPAFFMTICFAAVMDGSVYGDQCSPISDTTVLSAMCTGCDLMDHVKTQIPQATLAAVLAAIGWTTCVLLFA